MVKNIEGLDLTPSHAQTIRMKEVVKRKIVLDENVIYSINDGRKSEIRKKNCRLKWRILMNTFQKTIRLEKKVKLY